VSRRAIVQALPQTSHRRTSCAGVAPGGIAFSPHDARAMIARGYRFIVLGSDAGLIAGAAQRTVQAIRI